MKILTSVVVLWCAMIVLTIVTDTRAQDVPAPKEGKRIYSPYLEQTFPNRVYFGGRVYFSTGKGFIVLQVMSKPGSPGK